MNNITAQFEELPLWAKIIFLLFFGGLISPIYRILRYVETKNTVTLVVAIVSLVTCLSAVLAIIDIVTEITDNKIKILAD